MQRLKWWQKAVFYQIYPRSFADSNEDGIGDLEGIIQKLDYLKDLGIDAIWLSPLPSPLYDCGYDISDYMGVAPEYGTLADFKRFLDAAHRLELRVILDLVLNHTSDQHPWFLESRASRDNPRRDWYIWRDAKPDGSPPNNWNSTFGGSAWEWDEASGQYFYHFFFKQQPDLNWRNPKVKEAMFEAARFWLDLGADGYRLDAIGTIFEDPDLPDQECPVDHPTIYRMDRQEIFPSGRDQAMEYWTQMFRYQHDLPEVHDLMRELRTVVDEYEDRVLVGETDDILYCGKGQDELHMVFNSSPRARSLDPELVRQNQAERLSCLPPGGWPTHSGTMMSNGCITTSRMASTEPSGLPGSLGCCYLRGTPFLYNGEEIGMTDTRSRRLDSSKICSGLGLPPGDGCAGRPSGGA
jgi:alpha-glucosidase